MIDAQPKAGRIAGLYVYPIKGCRGVAMESLHIEPGGPRADRRYMVIDESGRFISQRSHPPLATVGCFPSPNGGLQLEAQGAQHLTLEPPPADSPLVQAEIWKDPVLVQVSEAGSAWFSQLLRASLRLVYLPPSQLRQTNPTRSLVGDLVGLADGYPLLWTNQASLDDLNARLEEPIPMARFRPNLITTGLVAYAEDTAEFIQAGGVEFAVPKLCDRCAVTTTDQLTGERSREPLRTLARYRKWNQAVWFGANLVPEQNQARAGFSLTVGDPLRIVTTRPHPAGTVQPAD